MKIIWKKEIWGVDYVQEVKVTKSTKGSFRV